MKKLLITCFALFLFSFSAKAQDGFEEILLASTEDAQKLMQAYFNPAMEGFIYGMNNGWYHTAKVHKVLGFDLQIGLSAAIVPSQKELFNIAALGLTSVSTTASTASTFAGPDNPTDFSVTRTISGQSVTTTFQLPGGVTSDLPLNAVPAPIAQLNVGLPWKLEAMLRFFPETDLGDDGGSAKMLGLGLKKEITSWFGPLEKTPLHVSLLAAYTTMDVSYGFEDQLTGDFQTQNAAAEFELDSFTVQAIASLNWPVLNLYGGIGYSSGDSSLRTTGTFRGVYTGPGNVQVTENLSNIALAFDAGGFRTTVGARLSLGFFKIFADYTLQEYNTISGGVAFSIR